jgi:hypothetical protein
LLRRIQRPPEGIPSRKGRRYGRTGEIQTSGVGFAGGGGIFISLFDGKYTTCVNRYDQCWGFIHGIETVLNHKHRNPCVRLMVAGPGDLVATEGALFLSNALAMAAR